MYLKRLKASMDAIGESVDTPLDDKDEAGMGSLMSKVNQEVQKREAQSRQTMNREQRPPTFGQQIP